METLQDRILILLKELGLNYSQFADQIGVQRSSISHVLSGRNKPSFEFLQKLFQAYPQINADWLIIGRKPMFLVSDEPDGANSSGNSYIQPDSADRSAMDFGLDDQKKIVQSEDPPLYDKKSEDITISGSPEGIETILILFRDGSFREYNPRSSSGV